MYMVVTHCLNFIHEYHFVIHKLIERGDIKAIFINCLNISCFSSSFQCTIMFKGFVNIGKNSRVYTI